MKKTQEEKSTSFGEADFWKIIESAKESSDGDVAHQAELVVESLLTLSEVDIVEFGNIFNKFHSETYCSDWWAAAHLINGRCTDDGFEDFRAWVISRGQKAFEEARQNPESLMNYINEDNIGECEAEILNYATEEAYGQKTGKDDFYEILNYTPTPVIVFDWKVGDDSLKNKFPNLFEKCQALNS